MFSVSNRLEESWLWMSASSWWLEGTPLHKYIHIAIHLAIQAWPRLNLTKQKQVEMNWIVM